MKQLTRFIVRHTIKNYHDIDDVQVRARFGALEAWASIILNTLLFVLKIAMGIMLSSVSLIADAVHTLSDTGTSIVILIGFAIARRPADKEHPFGHGRMESIATLIVAVLLIVAGFELLKSGAIRIWNPALAADKISWSIALLLFGTIIIKELMARFAAELGRMIQSQTLRADAWHHRSDALSTILVLAALAAGQMGLTWLDGVGGVLVAAVVLYSGYAVARDAVGPLLGTAPDREVLKEIEFAAGSIAGVQGVHDVIVHRYGQMSLVSLHIEVAADESVTRLHDLSERVEAAVERQLGGAAVVHIDPLDKSHPRYKEVHNIVAEEVACDKDISGFHDLRVEGCGDKAQYLLITFGITVEQADPEKTAQTRRELNDRLEKRLAPARIQIKAKPIFAYSAE